MIRSTSSQDDESVFLDEGLFCLVVFFSEIKIYKSFLIEDDPTTANTDNTNGKTNSFFTENYDHEHSTINTTLDDDISTRQVQRRKSVSSRFRSVSKEIT